MNAMKTLRLIFALSGAVLLLSIAGVATAQPEIPTRAPEDAPASLQMTEADEPGDPLVVDGIVTENGKPLAGASVFVYQTGADGVYGPKGNSDPRIHGYLRTDDRGRFTLRTVKPGSYPGTRVAPHIHLHATPAGTDREVTKELVFEGDPQVTARMRDSDFFFVGTPRQDDDGVIHVRWDVALD